MDNKFNLGDKVILDYREEACNLISAVTNWYYSPKTGYRYELEDKPNIYIDEKRLLLLWEKGE